MPQSQPKPRPAPPRRTDHGSAVGQGRSTPQPSRLGHDGADIEGRLDCPHGLAPHGCLGANIANIALLAWYAFRGDWLVCNSGISPAVTPSIKWACTSSKSGGDRCCCLRSCITSIDRATSRVIISAASTYRNHLCSNSVKTSSGVKGSKDKEVESNGLTIQRQAAQCSSTACMPVIRVNVHVAFTG